MKTQVKNGESFASIANAPGVDVHVVVSFKRSGQNPHPKTKKVTKYVSFVVENWDKLLIKRNFIFWEGTLEYEALLTVKNGQEIIIRYDDENKKYPFSDIRPVESAS
ncbi:MAG: hypothetical protein LBL47_00975 [Lactobacillus sp.]|jgi:hypothetical protein|nr:hypothetical protein [Lactobacillus sp.]